MKWSYDLTGAEPIIKDELVYDATTLVQGQLLMLGASAFTAGNDAGFGLVNAYPSTVMANIAVNAVGLAQETATTAGTTGATVSVATALNTTTGTGCYMKTIVNPFAVYRAQVSQSTASDALAVASSASTNKFAVTGVPASAFDGSWVYFCNSAGPNYGSLRKITSSATAGTQNLDAVATATITTADKVVVIAERNKNPHNLNSSATSIGQTTVAGFGATNLVIVENYIDRGAGVEILRKGTQAQINIGSIIAKTTNFYQDLMLKDHLFGTN